MFHRFNLTILTNTFYPLATFTRTASVFAATIAASITDFKSTSTTTRVLILLNSFFGYLNIESTCFLFSCRVSVLNWETRVWTLLATAFL